MHAVFLVGEALVDFEEWHHALHFPKVRRRRLAFDIAVHSVLEQNRADQALAAECRARNDTRPHLVHYVVHPLLVRPGIFIDAVELERLRRAAATLIQGSDKTFVVLDLLQLLVVRVHSWLLGMDVGEKK